MVQITALFRKILNVAKLIDQCAVLLRVRADCAKSLIVYCNHPLVVSGKQVLQKINAHELLTILECGKKGA